MQIGTICALAQPGAGENSIVDSLKKNLLSSAEDTGKVNTLNYLSKELRNGGNYSEALKFAMDAKNIAEKQARSSNAVIAKAGKKGLAKAYTAMAIIYWYQGNYPLALENNYASLKLYEELDFKKGIAAAYNNLGLIYTDSKNFDLALKNLSTSLKMYETLGEKKGIAASYNNIGNIYKGRRDYASALKNQFAALKIREELKDKQGIATSYNNIGLIYWNLGNYSESLKNHFASLELKQAVGDKQGIAGSYNNIGIVYNSLGKATEARKYLTRGLALSKEIGSLDFIKESYGALAKTDSLAADWKSSYRNYKLFIACRDSLLNDENTKKSVRLEMNYEFDKKEAAAKLEQEKKEAVSSAESRKQKIVIWSVCGILILVFAFAIYAYRSYLQKRKANEAISRQKEIIEQKQKEILDSIYYASRIQTALLTSETYIKRNLDRLIKKN